MVGLAGVVAVQAHHDEVVGIGRGRRPEVLASALLEQDGQQERPWHAQPGQRLDAREGLAVGADGIVGARQRPHPPVGEDVLDAGGQVLVEDPGHATDPPAVERAEQDRRLAVGGARDGVEQIPLQGAHGALGALAELAIDAGPEIPEPPQIALERRDERSAGGGAALQDEAGATIRDRHGVASPQADGDRSGRRSEAGVADRLRRRQKKTFEIDAAASDRWADSM